jgi:hypothetical protein
VIAAPSTADRAEKIAEHGGPAGSPPRAASTATAGPAA